MPEVRYASSSRLTQLRLRESRVKLLSETEHAQMSAAAHANRLKGGGQWHKTKGKDLAALKGGRYEARYGDGSEDHVRIALCKGEHGLICVTELMQHAID